MKWVIRIYSMILLGYSGWRTFDFIQSNLPKTDLSLWLSIAFLFATEAGLLLWHEISINHVTTKEQEHIATGLTWIDFVGSLAAGTADMILRQTLINGYQVPAALAQFLIFGLPLIMAANIGAVLYYLSNDAEVQLDRGKKELRFEVTRQAIRELNANKSAIAETMKRDIYAELRDDVTGKLERQYLRRQRDASADRDTTPRIVTPAGKVDGAKITLGAERFNADTEAVNIANPLPSNGHKPTPKA